ncbi:MAG: amino acid adenylation domain-containing protein [Acidobacteriota bacterium]
MDAIPDGIERLRPKVGELDLARAYTPLPLVAPEALAYVLYTSGSTGRPKGVMVSRQGLGRYLARAAAAYGPGGTWLLHTPVIYDLAITGLWLPLLSGGRVVLAPEPLPASGLGPLVPAGEERPRVKLTPSQARLLGETLLEPAETRELPWELVLGGEALSPSDVAWLAPGSRVHDEYGPTEAVVGSTVSSSTASSSAVSSSTVSSSTRLSDGEDGALEDITLDASTLDEGGQVVGSAGIGNSMPGCSAWLVDEALVRLPLGVPGELALGGGGLARGYLGQPRETAERFVPDPYSGGAGDRLYRTGDRARLRAGSEGRWRLEYLGREDSQLKVRGIRVEPAEVEASLASLASVRVAAVDGRRAGSGPIALTAWVVPAAPRPVEDVELFAKSLRQELGERLPEAMVPARVVVLDRLPTTAAGKVDRRSLPEPSAPAGAGVGRPPRQGTEESVARLWAELLGLEELPPAEEDFFALGGHSLVASRLVARLRRDYELEVPLSTVFSSPRLETFAAAVDELRGTPPLPPIQRLPDDERRGPSPLSFTQERMWLLHRLDPASPAYHVPAAVEISGQLDGRRLRQALAAVVARQTALRTRIVDTESGPAQVIDDSRFDAIGFDAIGFDDYGSDEGVLPLACVDLSSLPSELALAAAEGEARRFITLPFDLAAAPPWRGALYRFAPRRHLLVLSIHHVATDGWSMGILFSDLLAAYAGSALAPLPLEVIDHAAWQRQVLEGDVLETRLERWSQRLDGAPRLLEMPTDRPRPARLDDAGGRVAVGLAPALARRLRRFAEGRSTTPFVTLLALWQALLSRWTSHSDLPIGVPMTAREAPELESVVGPFIDTLVLRGDLRGDPSLEELVARGQRDALDAFSLRDLPFERLVDELEVERSLSHTPLFQVMFAFHDLPAAELSSGPLELRRWSLDTGAVQSDLGLVLAPEGEGIGGVLEYRSALFDEVTVERLAAAFQRLSAALLEQPRRPLSRAPLLSAAERSTVLEEWSGAGGPQTEPLPLVATVLDHARRYPAATAVVDLETGVELSYGDLAVRVMALTAELRSAGVRGEDRVAVLAHRSPALVVSLLAVLAVGAAFVPLDPGLPRRRRDEILTLAGCRHALAVAQTGDDTGEGAEVDLPVPTILVPRDALSPTANEPPVELPVELPDPQWPTVHPQNAAYVLFTSGSSGQPKGVVVSIIALERFLTGAQQLYGVSFSDRVLQMASPAFDTSIEEIFLTLRAGASLALRSADTLASPRRFFELCDDHGVTVLDLPTAWWHELAAAMEDGDLRAPTAVRLVILGGEEARAEVLPAWHRGTESGLRLINTYGPTETTVAVVASEGFAPETLRIPLGRPYEGIRALVLDRHLGPVLPGAAGELCIGGGTLARGYLGQPARTAEVFVPDPYGSRPGARLYRTGDRVRFATDGQLEFFGRLDRQVKLRGFRVEPGEVEAALLGCRGVGGAAVAVLDGPAGLALAAWVVADRSLEEIAAELGERVPSYQQPTLWAAVERLETTLTGKIDRRRMVAPSPLTVGSSFPVGGASPEEEGLAALWQQVLGVETVGAGDDFFALGGHSLAAARLIPRIREIFGVEMPLSDLFEAPTLRLQAERLGERMRSPLRPEPPPLEPAKQRHFLSFSQERLWFLDRLDPGSPAFGMPSALRLEGPVDPRALRAAWSALATRHEALRTCYPEVAGVPRAQLLPAPAPQSWPVVDLSGLAPSTAQEVAKGLASAERAYRFDLASAAPLRVLLLRHGPERWDLLVNVHHIAADGGSISILLDELQRLYVDLAAGREPSLPPPELQYADFAAWERRWLEDGGALPPLLELWRSRLGGDLPRVALPYDQSPSGESAPSRSGGLATLELGVEELRALHAAAGEGTTLYIALLSAFQLYLAALTGQRDQRVGTPVEVRPARALEGVVGMFTNTLVLRTDLGDDPDYDPDFGDVVERVRRTAVDAWALRELPYDRLLAALRADRDPRHAPLYEVWFVLQDEDPGLQVPGIRATPLPTDAGPTKFNLAANLSVTDKGLRGVLEYDRELFTAATGRRLAAGFQSVLEALARNPKIRLSTLTQQLAQRDEAAESAGRRRFEAHLKDRLGALRPGRRRGGFSPSSRKDPDS